MIGIKDVTILDILPYTFKTDEYTALSKAIAALTTKFYNTMLSVSLWSDIEQVKSEILDVMAAELDAPFYQTNMTVEQKRSIIAAAFTYNAKIGTLSSIQGLLSASFGGGTVSEWYDYGGKPYYFRANISRADGISTTYNSYEYFLAMLEKVKNKRAKLESITIEENLKNNYRYGSSVARIRRYTTIESSRE